MDNFQIDVTGVGRENFDLAMKLAFQGGKSKTATHYAKDQDNSRFVLLRSNHPNALILPTPLNLQAASDLVYHWLMNEAAFGRQPGHDGDNKQGWRVFNESWGHVKPYDWHAFLAIKPSWAMYGK